MLAAAVLVCGCKHHEAKPAPAAGSASAPPAPASAVDQIPHTSGPIRIDGDWDEPDWPQHAARFQFVGSDGQLARPSSEVRFLYDESNLYVGLYAADENITTATDAFELTVGTVALRLDPKGTVTPARADVKVGIDADGTLDKPDDDDEEWKLEVSVPLSATGLAPGNRVPIQASRCDVTKDGVKRCGSWTGTLGLAPPHSGH